MKLGSGVKKRIRQKSALERLEKQWTKLFEAKSVEGGSFKIEKKKGRMVTIDYELQRVNNEISILKERLSNTYSSKSEDYVFS